MIAPGDRARLILAIAVNLGIGQTAAAWMGLPRWTGSLVAGAAMAAASMPDQLPPAARGLVQIAVLPGNLTAQLLADKADKLDQPRSPENADY